MKPLYLYILWICLLRVSVLQAQSDLRFEHLTEREGLSNNAVTSIYQDREGFMWFGTVDGLNRYNGYEFKIFRPDPRNLQHTLKENLIYNIYEDSQERFWVGTNGLHLLDKFTDTFMAYMVDSSNFTYLNIALTLHEDKKGLIWFSAGGGLNRFDPTTKKFTSYLLPELTPNFGLAEDESGTFWMGSGAGLYQFNPQNGKFTSFPLPDTTNPHPFIKALLLDSEGILWIGTDGADLFRLDTRRTPARAVIYNPEKQVNKLISNNGIMEDKAGYIWLATAEGLQRIDKKSNQVSTYRANPAVPGSLSSNQVNTVYQDKAGTLWVGTDNGINKLITYTKPFHSYQVKFSTDATQLEENK
jgi:ligand-binding sensor domain-containing protein